MVEKKLAPLDDNQKANINIAFTGTPPAMEDFVPMKIGSLNTGMGLKDPGSSIVPLSNDLTYSELYTTQWNKYEFPPRNLQYNKCVGRCDKGKAAVNGICLDCRSPCAECRNNVNRCVNCRQDQPAKYHFGTRCYEKCPIGTETDEVNKKCIGCGPGCDVCTRDNPRTHCLKCSSDPIKLYLFNKTCVSSCPDGYVINFLATECISAMQTPVVWFPCTLLMFFCFIIAYCGYHSSRNVTKQHRRLLSFYALMGVVDWCAMIQ